MKVKAIIKTVSAPKEGTSEATGNQWRSQRLVLEWTEGDPGQELIQRVCAAAFGDLVDGLQRFHVGDQVMADLRFRTSRAKGSDYVGTLVDLNAISLC